MPTGKQYDFDAGKIARLTSRLIWKLLRNASKLKSCRCRLLQNRVHKPFASFRSPIRTLFLRRQSGSKQASGSSFITIPIIRAGSGAIWHTKSLISCLAIRLHTRSTTQVAETMIAILRAKRAGSALQSSSLTKLPSISCDEVWMKTPPVRFMESVCLYFECASTEAARASAIAAPITDTSPADRFVRTGLSG